jgi:hypothetical protein
MANMTSIESHDDVSIDDIKISEKELIDLLDHLAKILANDYVEHMKRANLKPISEERRPK